MSSSSSEKCEVNFWRPASNRERKNNKVIGIMIIIWALAVFGFQIMLIVLNKPTPEESYIKFEQIWPKVSKKGKADPETTIEFAKILLTTLGKEINLQAVHSQQLKETFSWTVYSLVPKEKRYLFRTSSERKHKSAARKAIRALQLERYGKDKLLADLVEYSLVPVRSSKQYRTNRDNIPIIMQKYLVHNRSILTEFKFLGFPFHYWYSAQFLLILFVALCWYYAHFTDRLNKKYKVKESNH